MNDQRRDDNHKDKPAPLETGPGEQQDDNIDDLGNRRDGKEQDQPVKKDDKAGLDGAKR